MADDAPHSEPQPDTPAVLAEILAHKREEVEAAKSAVPFAQLEAEVAQAEPPRNFFRAVTRPGSAETTGPDTEARTAVIAEIKRRSPSAGLIRPEYDGEGFAPEDIARQYETAGASAISCLTDERFFGGHLSYIQRVKDAVRLPVLRKDFLIDPWQLWQSRAAGADAILLIAEALTESRLVDMLILAQQLQMTALVEVHSMDNLLRVRPHIGFPSPHLLPARHQQPRPLEDGHRRQPHAPPRGPRRRPLGAGSASPASPRRTTSPASAPPASASCSSAST